MVVSRSWSCSFCIGPAFLTRSFQGPVYSYQFTKAKAAWLKRIWFSLPFLLFLLTRIFVWLWGIGFTSPGSWWICCHGSEPGQTAGYRSKRHHGALSHQISSFERIDTAGNVGIFTDFKLMMWLTRQDSKSWPPNHWKIMIYFENCLIRILSIFHQVILQSLGLWDIFRTYNIINWYPDVLDVLHTIHGSCTI